MSGYVFPVDNWTSGGSAYTGRRLRQMLGALITGKTSARPLGGRSGVMPGTPSSTLAVTTSTWTVHPHSGVVDAQTAAAAGVYFYSFDADQTGSINARDALNTRIDLLSVQISDPAESDGTSTPDVSIVYTAGVPGSGAPAAPARSLVIGTITVPPVGGAAVSVVLSATVTVAAGGVIPCSSSAQYPASPYVGMYVDDASVGGALLRWNGAAWVRPEDTGVVTSGIAMTAGSGWNTLSYAYRVRNGVLYLTITATRTGADLTGSSTGGLADVTVATITDGAFCPPWTQRPIFETGTTSGAAHLTTGGVWAIRDLHPTSVITAGDTVQSCFVYPLG